MAKISDKLLQEQLNWTPHGGQKEVLRADKRDIDICAGTRWGKSLLCAYVAFRRLLADNQQIWIVSLTYDMAKKIFDYVIDFAAQWDKRLLKGVQNRPFPRFEVKEWGSWIECKSADNETSLMGEELDLAILDEAARMKPDIWQRYIIARLASRKGKSFKISTPFGKNWFYNNCMETKGAEDGAYFHFPSNANPYFPPEEWERAKQRLPRDIFQQEYEAVFLSDAASVFRNIRTCIADTYEEPRPGHRYVMGLDLAKFGDFTVITIVDRDSHRVVFWDRFTKLPYTLQKERILNVARKYHCLVVIDAMNVGAAMADELRAEGLSVQDFKATGTISKDIDKQGSKEKMVEKLSLFFEQRNVIIPPEEVLIDELESFSYHLTPSGNLVYGAPEGFHDDCVTSLGLALMPLTGQRRTENIKVARSMPVKRKSFQYF
jgi:hypothetical protein